jgi:hypothetical protein
MTVDGFYRKLYAVFAVRPVLACHLLMRHMKL